MDFSGLLNALQNLTKERILKKDIAECLGFTPNNYIRREKEHQKLTTEQYEKISKCFGVDIADLKNYKKVSKSDNDCVYVNYRPDVYLSAGYGIEVFDESAEKMVLDAALFVSDRGNKINPEFCEIVRVSGNSMTPEYRHGDRVIIDKGDKTLSDGHIFAFRYKGECYVKEINLLGGKIKCISLNKEYDSFYIQEGEEFTVLGKILPRIRL